VDFRPCKQKRTHLSSWSATVRLDVGAAARVDTEVIGTLRRLVPINSTPATSNVHFTVSSRRIVEHRGSNLHGAVARPPSLKAFSRGARGPPTIDLKKRESKLAPMASNARMRCIMILQEVHGSGARPRRFVASLPRSYSVLCNGAGRAGTGGVAVLAPFFDKLDVVDLAKVAFFKGGGAASFERARFEASNNARWLKSNPEMQDSGAKEQQDSEKLSYTACNRIKRKKKFGMLRVMYTSKLAELVPPSPTPPRSLGSGLGLAAASGTTSATSKAGSMMNVGDLK
ncbi:unnamed protein product, partial [Prorocentrum cordatum]